MKRLLLIISLIFVWAEMFGQCPVLNAGPDQSVCTNQIVALNATASGFPSSTQWTTSGSGVFANSSALNTSYIPSASDIAAGSVELKLTSNGPFFCPKVTDVLLIHFKNCGCPNVSFTTTTLGFTANFNAVTSPFAQGVYTWVFGDGT